MNDLNGHIELTTELQQAITADQAWHYRIVPKLVDDVNLTFYTADDEAAAASQDELEILFGKEVNFEGLEAEVLNRTLGRYYRRTASNSRAVEVGTNQADDFLTRLIMEAKNLDSSDIHIEIYDDRARVRIRIDGMLVERYQLNKSDYPALVNKVKIRANLDISEKRLPQDGRIRIPIDGNNLDMRVSVLPTLHGEKIVMRLLSNDATNIDIAKLGMDEQQLRNYMEGVRRPNGIILMSGPTGSGKTTSLYATLKILNEEKRNIVTVEDPIEYTLEGINQVQLKESIGLTFASALKSFLRQDPDIIMLGEIRDGETAQMAVRAALTGHLVLSTIHTNSAWGTIDRLIDMGVPPFLLSSTMNTTAAQRLLRLLCEHCKEERTVEDTHLPAGFKAPRPLEKHYAAVGCESCYYTGYKGRTAVYEVVNIDHELATCIKHGEHDIGPQYEARKLKTLADQAFALLESGRTSAEEAYPLLLNQL